MNYQIAVEDKDAVTKVVTVSIPAGKVSEEIETALKQVSNTVSMKGFRPGKAPRQLVEQMHGERVRSEVTERLIARSFDEAMRENKIDYIGEPRVTVEPVEPGKEISYSAEVTLYPRPEVTYESFSLCVPKLEVQNAEIDGVVERLRDSKANFRPIDRKNAVVGDAAEFTVQLEVNGKNEGAPHKMKAVLSKGEIHPALDAGIVGMQIGEQKVIEPEVKEVEGKHLEGDGESDKKKDQVKYHVRLDALHEKEMPEVDDAFAKSIDDQIATLLEFRIKIREMLEKDRAETTKRNTQTALLKQLVENNQFVVPNVLIDSEMWNMLIRGGMIDPSKVKREQVDFEKLRAQFGEPALERVRGYIALDRIAEKEDIKSSEDDIKDFINEFAHSSGMSEKELKSYFSNKERMTGFVVEASRKKTLEFLTARAKVEFVEESSEAAPNSEKPKKSKGKVK